MRLAVTSSASRRMLWISAGVALAFLAGWMSGVFLKVRNEGAARLLAQAYTERRTLELRIPGASYTPMRQERGAETALGQTGALLDAVLAISRHLKKDPTDPVWLQAKARVDLLDHHYEAALDSLHRILGREIDSPEFLTDIATVYFERAQATDHIIDYGNAVEYLGEALAKAPDNDVALFNRAIVCEKIFLYTQASEDWKHYLRVDPSGGWSNEARSRLSNLRAKIEKRELATTQPLLSPSQIVQLNSHDLQVLQQLDERIEEYIHIAISQWLPEAYPLHATMDSQAADARHALRFLSQWLARQHNDQWLNDLLATNSNSRFPAAVQALAQALKANENGETTIAQQSAKEADLLFVLSGNPAGALRARVEYIFATHLTQAGGDCLRAATRFRRLIESYPYSWLKAQYHLESGTCFWLTGNLGQAQEHYETAATEAEASRYNALYLRTQDHIAALDGTKGDFRASWQRIHRALGRFWSESYDPMRGYNLYYNLQESARARKQMHLQMSAWDDGLALSESSPDQTLHAMAHSLMANAAANAGQPKIAEHEYTLAERLFERGPRVASTRVARLEAETRLAEVEIELGKSQQAADRLRKLTPEVSLLTDNFLGLLFYNNLGEAETRLHHVALAESALQSAITFAETDLRSLKDERSKQEWSQKSSAVYRNLAELKLEQGETEQALEIWEWYQGAGLRSRQTRDRGYHIANYSKERGNPASTHLDDSTSFLRPSEVARQMPALKDETVLSYVRLSKDYLVWGYDDRGIFSYRIPAPAAYVEALAKTFRRLCSDPNSDLALLRQQARVLYDLLLAPVEGKWSSRRALVIETDGELTGVPFNALINEQGRYLSETHQIRASLGIYYRTLSHPSVAITQDSSALIVAVPAPRVSAHLTLQPLPDVESEGEMVASGFHAGRLVAGADATLGAIRARLQNVSVFHFAGHAVASPQQTGLLLQDETLSYASLRATDLSRMQLAVFSACDTLGDLDGEPYNPDNLVRLFMSAGVPHVVASGWNVDSAATKLFMGSFYAALFGGDSVDQALMQAETALRAQPGMAHPYYWSAFTEFGVN